MLVGHSYGGPVIGAAAPGNPNVKALVFVSAYPLDKGESVAGLGDKYPTSQLTASVLNKVPIATAGGQDVDLYVDQPGFESVFASGLPTSQASIMQATQRPLALSALSEKAPAPACKTIPSWAVLSTTDLVIPPDEQQFMYSRAKSKVTRVEAGHTALVSHPDAVVKVIEEAAAATRLCCSEPLPPARCNYVVGSRRRVRTSLASRTIAGPVRLRAPHRMPCCRRCTTQVCSTTRRSG